MKKIKYPIKKKRNKTHLEKYILEDQFKPNRVLKIVFYLLITLLPLILSFLYLRSSYIQNQVFSFPLDDPWIHLTFAKNLVQYFSFSYFKNEMVTAGSTSPLYTILVAIGFLITKNEMAISYILGMLFFILASITFYKLSSYEFDRETLYALFCTGIFIIDKWMNFISVSGMETTMFIFILLLCAYFYKNRKAVPFAITLGLIMWIRPDGIVFIVAVIIDYILIKTYLKHGVDVKFFSDRDLKNIVLIFLGIIGIYFAMNLLLSGSILPNTYNAKLTYYSPELRSREEFLKYEVWAYFKAGSYYILMIGFLISVLKLFYDFYKKTYNQNTIYIVFILGLIFIYWLKLPYAHRFGRYMMPVIPFFILVATIGFRDLARISKKITDNTLFSKIVFYIFIGITFYLGIKDYDENKAEYIAQCKYIYDRQVTAAKWIKNNTRESDIIATHDVGAIGFYSDRMIVDVAGLVTPELIDNINKPNYVNYMTDFMKSKGVTYLAFLREWYRVSNQNPLFTTANYLPPEVMEVYKFDPEKTHVLSREANSLLMHVQMLISQKAGQQLISILNRLIVLEPNCAFAYYYKAYAHSLLKDDINFEKNMLKAVALFPEYKEAHLYLGEFYKNSKRFAEAKTYLTKTLELEPGNVQAINSLKVVSDSLQTRKQ